MIKYILNLFNPVFKYKETFKRDDVSTFFNEIDSRFKAYLQVTILRPGALVESGDTSFNKLDIYKQLDTVSDKIKTIFYNSIKTYKQNYVNSYYVVLNDQGFQPITFSIWYIGSELRIGCFYHPSHLEKVGLDTKKVRAKLDSLFVIINGVSGHCETIREHTIERNNFVLIEKQIKPEKGKILENQEFIDFVSQLFSNISCNFLKYYLEERENK